MALRGRGSGYTSTRHLVEMVLGRVFDGDWAARRPFAHTYCERRELTMQVPGLPRDFGPLRIGFASDLHAGPTTAMQTLEQAFAHLRAFRPHLLLLGGDYVVFEARFIERVLPLVASVPAPLGRYAVLGNHDLWADDRHIQRALESAGVEFIVNRTVRPLPFLSLGGLDDAWTGRPDYDAAFQDPAAVHVLLMHSPDHVPALGKRPFDVALCGHTHGGHISYPTGAPILMTSRVSKRYPHGRFELEGGPLFVSRGVGNVEVPLRAFAPPDVLCLTLGSTA